MPDSPKRSQSPAHSKNSAVAAQPADEGRPAAAASSHVPPVTSYESMFPDVLDVMEFESWWTERSPSGNSVRRYMLILYFPSECQFQVTVDDSKAPLSLKVVNRMGEPLHAYDLHVGAVIDILGRPTTLMAASLRTITWIEKHTRRLWKRKLQLEEKVNRFRPMPLHALDYGVYKKLRDANVALGGTVPMRKILDVLRDLETELSQYQ